MLPWLGVTGNYSETFAAPNNGNNLLDGTPPNISRSSGRDFGLRLDLLEGRVFVVLNRYNSKQVDRLISGIRTTEINRIWNNLDRNDLAHVAYRDMESVSRRGFEADVTANPTRSLRLMANFARPRTYLDSNHEQLRAYVDRHLPAWQAGAGDPTNPNWTQINTDLNNIQRDLAGAVTGTVLNGTPKYTANGYVTLTMPAGRFKGVSFGAGMNLRGPKKVAASSGDPFSCLYAESYRTVSTHLTYSRRFGRVNARFQLNVSNLLDEDTLIASNYSSYRVGNVATNPLLTVPSAYRYLDPRKATLTTSLALVATPGQRLSLNSRAARESAAIGASAGQYARGFFQKLRSERSANGDCVRVPNTLNESARHVEPLSGAATTAAAAAAAHAAHRRWSAFLMVSALEAIAMIGIMGPDSSARAAAAQGRSTPANRGSAVAMVMPPANAATTRGRSQPPTVIDPHLDKSPARNPRALELNRNGWIYNCMECHTLLGARWRYDRPLNEHRDIGLDHGNNRYCLNCHHPANRNAFADYDGAEIPQDEIVQLCAKCHGTIFRDWQAGVHGRRNGYWNAQSGRQTTLACIQCHAPHAPRFPDMKPLAPLRYPPRAAHSPAARPDAARNVTQNGNNVGGVIGERVERQRRAPSPAWPNGPGALGTITRAESPIHWPGLQPSSSHPGIPLAVGHTFIHNSPEAGQIMGGTPMPPQTHGRDARATWHGRPAHDLGLTGVPPVAGVVYKGMAVGPGSQWRGPSALSSRDR